MNENNKVSFNRNSLFILLSLIVALSSTSIVATQAQFSQSGTANATIKAAVHEISFTHPDSATQSWISIGNNWLPGQTPVIKEMSAKNTGTEALKYRLSSPSLDTAYYKSVSRFNVKLYVQDSLKYNGKLAGMLSEEFLIKAGETHAIKIELSWIASSDDNQWSGSTISFPIHLASTLENGDTGFILFNGVLTLSGNTDYWVEYVWSADTITTTSARVVMDDNSRYKNTILQYSTKSDFSNAKNINVPDPTYVFNNKSIVLTGLTPNTTYYVRTKGDNPAPPIANSWSTTYTFKTLP